MPAAQANAQNAAITVGARRIGNLDFLHSDIGVACLSPWGSCFNRAAGGERMIDRELDIQTADGAMNTFVTHPEEGGPHPVVLFYMDAPGKRGELHDMARRLGSVGYFVVLPNLYYR